MPDLPLTAHRYGTTAWRLLALAVVLLASWSLPSQASAATTPPPLTFSVDAQDRVLYGTDATVKLHVTNASPTLAGHNVAFRIVLVNGLSYVPGSAGAGAPTVIPNKPVTGQTTLIWRNLADLPAATTYDFSFKLAHPGLSYSSLYTVSGGAYVSGDPLTVPSFDAAGTPLPTADPANPSSSATGNDTTQIGAIELEQSESSPAGELLRGVHDHQTVYSLTVRNNPLTATTSPVVHAYLPAGLEYLGCGGTDQTTDAPTNAATGATKAEESPGAGPITVPALSGCSAPAVVDTISTYDPDAGGPLPARVVTQVSWTAATLAPGASVTFTYRAAIPLRANTMTWSGGTAPNMIGGQARNLDNNSGPEVAPHAALTTYAAASGYFDPSTTVKVAGSAELTRTAADLRILDSVASTALAPGATTDWTLTVATSEYRSAAGLTVTEVLPDGLCPLQVGVNLTAPSDPLQDAECGPATGAEVDPSAPYATAVEQADGRWQLTWTGDPASDPALAELAPSGTHAITFRTMTRANYQDTFLDQAPLRSFDQVTDAARVDGTLNVACVGQTVCADAGSVRIAHDGADSIAGAQDTDAVTLTAIGPTVTKRVGQTLADCDATTLTNFIAGGSLATAPKYLPGDRICWLLDVAYPGAVGTFNDQLRDALPATARLDTAYGSGGEQPFTAGDPAENDTLTASFDGTGGLAAGGGVGWTLDPAPAGPQHFNRRLATRATAVAPAALGQRSVNALRVSATNSAGTVFAIRDEAGFELQQPVLGLQTQIIARNGSAAGLPAASLTVNGGDTIRYRAAVTNSGTAAAQQVEVWDTLPATHSCADVVVQGGSCSAGAVQWTLPTVAVGATVNVTYDVVVRGTLEPTQSLVNQSGIRQFTTPVNTGGDFVYVPANNIDQVTTPTGNATVADARSSTTIVGQNATITKSRTTSVNAGAEDGRATIGEEITYRIKTVIPKGETIHDAVITDPTTAVPAERLRQPYVRLDDILIGGVSYTPGTLPAGFAFTDNGGLTPTLTLPATYVVSPAADREIELVFTTRLADVPGNVRTGGSLPGRAHLSFDAGAVPVGLDATQINTVIVEPVVTLAKTAVARRAGAVVTAVAGGDEITYSVTIGSSNDATGAPAHDSTLVDAIPVGLTPVKAGGGSVAADGDLTEGGGTWSETNRTITFQPSATLEQGTGGAEAFVFRATVDIPPRGGSSLTTTATATTTSLTGASPNERTSASTPAVGYTQTAANTHLAQTATVAITADKTMPTIGEKIEYTATVTLPANVTFNDTTVTGKLLDAVEFDGYDLAGSSCTAGCPPDVTINAYTPATVTTTTTIGWDLGDLPGGSADRTVVLKFHAYLRNLKRNSVAKVVAGNLATTTVTVASNRTNKNAPFNAADAIPTVFDDVSTLQRNDQTVVEPQLTFTTEIQVNSGSWTGGPTQARPGDALRYRLTVTNTGTSTLYDGQVSELISANLTNVTLDPGTPALGSTNIDDWTAGDPAMTWTLAPLVKGTAVVIAYSAQLQPIATLANNDPLNDAASVSAGYGLPLALRTGLPALYRGYSGATDVVVASVDTPTPTIHTYVGASGVATTGPAEVGKPFTSRVELTNANYIGGVTTITLRDTLPRDWDYVAGSATLKIGGVAQGALEPTVTPAADPAVHQETLTWTSSTSLTPGAILAVTYTATPRLSASVSIGVGAAKPHTHSVSATVADGFGNLADFEGAFDAVFPGGTATTVTANATLTIPVFTVVQTPDAGSVVAGATATYSVRLTNTSTTAGASNVVVTDTLPAGTTYTAAAATAVPATGFTETSADASTAVWRVASLAPGASVTITVPVKTSAAVPAATSLVNSASVTATETTLTTTDTGTFTVATSADLEAAKTASAATVVAGSTLTYTVGVTNKGLSVARAVAAVDVLPAAVSFVSATPDTTVAPGATCSNASGTVSCAFGDLAPGVEATATITVGVDPAASTNADNRVDVSSTTTDPVAGNNYATVAVAVVGSADLSILKTASHTQLLNGGSVGFTLTIHNAGPSTASAVQVVDTLPAGLDYVSDDAGCSVAARVITCAVGTLANGASRTIAITARGAAAGPATNTAVIGGGTSDPQPADNSASAAVLVKPAADLRLTVTAPADAAPDSDLTYSLKVDNTGPDDATVVAVTYPLLAGVTFVSGDPGCVASATTVTCTLGSIADGQSATRAFTVHAAPSLGASQLAVEAVVSGTEADPLPASDRSAFVTRIAPVPVVTPPDDPVTAGGGPGADGATAAGGTSVAGGTTGPGGRGGSAALVPPTTLGLTQKLSGTKRVRGGAALTYVVRIKNTGGATAFAAQVCSRLPTQLTYRTLKGGKLQGSRLCFTAKRLEPGKSVVYKLRVRVNPRAKQGTVSSQVTITAENAPRRTVSVKAKIVTDGKINPKAVHGFTG